MFLLFIAVVFFGVFLSSPKEVPATLVFNKPKVNVDTKILDSAQFKSLQPFAKMQTQYSYEATDEENSFKTGFITAASKEAAMAILENSGLSVSELKEAKIGRDNPFSPYYQQGLQPTLETNTSAQNNTVKR